MLALAIILVLAITGQALPLWPHWLLVPVLLVEALLYLEWPTIADPGITQKLPKQDTSSRAKKYMPAHCTPTGKQT